MPTVVHPPGRWERVRARLRGLQWYELLPEIVLVAGLTYFLIDEPDAATSAFASSKAITLMVIVATGWIIARVVLALVVRWPGLRLAIFGAAAIAVLAVVVLPAYDDTTVVETFPDATASPSSSSTAPSGSAPATGVTPTTVAPVPDPVVIGTDALEGIDHRASGTVKLYRRADGSHVVGLEGIDVQPGPDYDVYVVPGSDRRELADAQRLDDLRGNQGTQYYDVATGIGIGEGPWTVLIWCETFSVPIAGATPV